MTTFIEKRLERFDRDFPYGVMSGTDGDLDITDEVRDFISKSLELQYQQFVESMDKSEEQIEELIYSFDAYPGSREIAKNIIEIQKEKFNSI